MKKVPFLPVKIMDKKWIEKLLDGDLFMRSLHEFGSWSVMKDASNKEKMKSGVQKDISEGTVKTVDLEVGDPFYDRLSPQFKSVVKKMYYIDQDCYQYSKLFCMYALTYLPEQRCFEKPDDRLQEFGDTALIITNPNEFLQRVLNGLLKKYGDNTNFKLDEVKYYPANYYGYLDEFCKADSYAWQNEIRMRVYLLDENNTKLDEDSNNTMKALLKNKENIIVPIGSIRDICIEIPVEKLVDMDFPEEITNIFEVL